MGRTLTDTATITWDVTTANQVKGNVVNPGLTVGTTAITGGTTTRVLFNNGGVLGEYTISGTGSVVMTTSPTLVTPNLGTPSALTLTNATGLPVAGLTGLGTGVADFLAIPSSANLATAVTGETGSGALVFATSPSLVTPALGVATATSLAVGGAAIGSHAISATGTASISSTVDGGAFRAGPSGVNVWSTSPGVGTPKIAFDQVSSGTAGVVYVASDSLFGFNSTNTLLTGSVDTRISRQAAGVVQFGTTAANASGIALAAAFRTSTALNTATDGGLTAAFTANMVGSTGGPTTAAQNGWVIMQDSAGASIWVPVWK